MLIGHSSVFKVINDFSRQLFLIKTPGDFGKGLKEAFRKVVPEIELFTLVRLQWDENPVSLIASNHLHTIGDIKLDRDQLERLLLEQIKQDKSLINNDLKMSRAGKLLPFLNPWESGSEMISSR